MDRQGYSRKLDKSVVGIQLQGRGQVLVHRGKGVAGLVAQQGNQAECHKERRWRFAQFRSGRLRS